MFIDKKAHIFYIFNNYFLNNYLVTRKKKVIARSVLKFAFILNIKNFSVIFFLNKTDVFLVIFLKVRGSF